jgi:hypothetical protein
MIKILNPELYNRYTEFLKASLILLNDFLKKGDRIPDFVYDFFKPVDSGWSGIYVREKNFPIFIERHEEDIVNLPYFIKLIELMVQDTKLRDKLHGILINENEPVTISNIETAFIGNWIMPIIESFVERSQSFVFNDRLCDELYKKYEDFFYSAERDLNPIAPLHNFKSELEVILLDENLKIRTICEEEQKQLWLDNLSMIPQHEVPSIKLVLEARYKVIAHRPDEMSYIKELFDMVISAMRLFKKGTVGYNRVFTKIYWACPISKASMSSGKNYYEPYHGTQYNLSKDEVEDLVKFWKAYKDVNFKKYSFIELAIKRFNLAHVRKDFEDKLIDMMIAFEALYLIHTDKAELSYKLAIRAAFVLGKDKNKSEQEKMYIFLKKAYDVRSGIVHGNKHLGQNKIKLSDGREISVQDFILQLEDYLRQSILHFINLSMKLNVKEMAKYLDRIMFS